METPMIKVVVYKQSQFPISSVAVKRRLAKFLASKGVVSNSQISVAIVGESKMKLLTLKYLKEKNSLHNVLSFTESEIRGKFVYPKSGFTDLGEIVVCFPVACDEANKEDKLIEDKVIELLEHGVLHLLGVHHK